MRLILACSLISLTCTELGARPVPMGRDYLERQAVVAEGTIEPAGVPLKARLIAQETVYYLDRSGLTPEELQQQLDAAPRTGQLPPAPRIDVAFELENTSGREVQLLVGGDVSGSVRLFLRGPGAANITLVHQQDAQELKKPAVVTLPPYGRHRWVFKQLECSGPRDRNRLYWTQPGEYLLSAGFTVALRPALKGMVPHWVHKDHGNVAITSGTLRLTVLEPR